MQVIAFNGSPRAAGNTAALLRRLGTKLQEHQVGFEIIHIGGRPVQGCTACFRCFSAKDGTCALTGDDMNAWIARMRAADAIILASPTYFADLTPALKALIDRAGMVGRANQDCYKRKLGAAVVAVRRGGAIHVFDSINHFFTISQMLIVGSSYWNLGVGREPGAVEKDDEGMQTMDDLGENLAWALRKLA